MSKEQIPKKVQGSKDQGSNERADANVEQKRTPRFDLEERAALFGEQVIDLLKQIPETAITRRLIDQLVGAATSMGANYCEASEAVSKKEFRQRIGICKKEAKETKFFLRMIARAVPEQRETIRTLWTEAKELHLIFCSIYRK